MKSVLLFTLIVLLWPDSSYSDATEEELQRLSSDTCSICFGNFDEAKRLPCNHFFHKECLRQWFERQDVSNLTCPVCRQPVRNTALPPVVDNVANDAAAPIPPPPAPQRNESMFS